MKQAALPPIFLAADEADQLSALAARAQPDVADFLEGEIERAQLVAAADLPPGVVRIGSTVTFRDHDGLVTEVTLVLPEHADVAAGRISILTPVGAALIGMSRGQRIEFAARRGRRSLTVVSVKRVPAGAAAG